MRYVSMFTHPLQYDEAVKRGFLPVVQPRSVALADDDDATIDIGDIERLLPEQCGISLAPRRKGDVITGNLSEDLPWFISLIERYTIYKERLKNVIPKSILTLCEGEWFDRRKEPFTNPEVLKMYNSFVCSIIKHFFPGPLLIYYRSIQSYYVNKTTYRMEACPFWNEEEDVDFVVGSFYDPTCPQAELHSLISSSALATNKGVPFAAYVGFDWASLGGGRIVEYDVRQEWMRGRQIGLRNPAYIGFWTPRGVDFTDQLFLDRFEQFDAGFKATGGVIS